MSCDANMNVITRYHISIPKLPMIHKNYVREMFVRGQFTKYVRLDNIALYGIHTLGAQEALLWHFGMRTFSVVRAFALYCAPIPGILLRMSCQLVSGELQV